MDLRKPVVGGSDPCLKADWYTASLMGSCLTARVKGGCPQGGVLSHLLWNLVVDRLLTITNDLGLNTFGYADDIVIIVQGKFTHTIREVMQNALNVVVKWTVKEMLPLK